MSVLGVPVMLPVVESIRNVREDNPPTSQA